MADETIQVPEITSPEWSDYVFTHFTEDELVDNNPKVDALRRVTELLLGRIIVGQAKVVQCPDPNNDQRATVEYTVDIVLKDGGSVTVTEAADVYHGNAASYANHPVAFASTRAEGRALRKALRLQRVVAAEEAIGGGEADIDVTVIQSSQLTAIRVITEKLGINLTKFINMGERKYVDMEKIPYVTAVAMIKKLNEFQRKPDTIPISIKKA